MTENEEEKPPEIEGGHIWKPASAQTLIANKLASAKIMKIMLLTAVFVIAIILIANPHLFMQVTTALQNFMVQTLSFQPGRLP